RDFHVTGVQTCALPIYINITSYIGHLFFPKKSTVLSHGPKFSTSYFFNEKMERTDNINLFEYLFDFRDRSKLNLGVTDEYVELRSEERRVGKGSRARMW